MSDTALQILLETIEALVHCSISAKEAMISGKDWQVQLVHTEALAKEARGQLAQLQQRPGFPECLPLEVREKLQGLIALWNQSLDALNVLAKELFGKEHSESINEEF